MSDFQLTEAFVNENQVAIIDIVAVDDDGEPIEVPAEALRDAIAQLVYTATGLPEDDAVRAVRIRIDGQAATLRPKAATPRSPRPLRLRDLRPRLRSARGDNTADHNHPIPTQYDS